MLEVFVLFMEVDGKGKHTGPLKLDLCNGFFALRRSDYQMFQNKAGRFRLD